MSGPRVARAWCLCVLMGMGLPAFGTGSDPDPVEASAAAAGSTSGVPAGAQSPAPQVVSLLVGGGTVALILSGHDREDPEEDTSDPGLAAPELLTPASGAEVEEATVELAWKPVEGAASYLVDVDACDRTNDVCADLVLQVTAAVSYSLAVDVASAYRWRVRAVAADRVAGPFTEFRSFMVAQAGL